MNVKSMSAQVTLFTLYLFSRLSKQSDRFLYIECLLTLGRHLVRFVCLFCLNGRLPVGRKWVSL